MTIFLVRHAHAGKRSEWEGDDTVRPISGRGAEQTTAITELLADRDVRRIVSSPYARCLQTVEPLAAKVGVDVEADARLAERADVDPALELLLSLDGANGVACSHGDLIPALLDRLVEMGMAVEGPLRDQKGSIWSIHLTDGRPTAGCYTPPQA